MLLETCPGYDFKMRYFNSDGREASLCGNGSRCIVAYAHRLGLFLQTTRFLAADGEHQGEITLQGVRVKMNDVSRITVTPDYFFLDTGSPHYVKVVADAFLLKLNLYLIIDEYDNFTNTILSTYGTETYQKATHGEGFFRFFFNVIKAATTGSEQALKRMFITGVSPITLDDVTSGFNIGSNFTTDPQFNGIVGFSETELRTMLTYYKEEGTLKAEVEDLITMMKPWYDNYCFAEETLDESMFNSDMVLYFLSTFLRLGTPPKEMIDRNIRTDYNKIRHLIRIDRELGANFSIIREIVENGRTTANINSSFPADRMVDTNNFKSLLYYFGLLTISGTERETLYSPSPTRRYANNSTLISSTPTTRPNSSRSAIRN